MIKFKDVPAKQWVKAAIACITYILFIVWVGNFWWLFLLPVIFDIFVTKIIPWSAWRKIKNKPLYTLCSWLDAIIFALVAVYFVNLYLFQNFRIPSSSLEKSLLVGDFLLVSKVSYGPRVPITPLSLPLVQNTMPISGGKSYCDKVQWDYKRLAGLDTIKAMDIVVFNFPVGDTVAVKMENPDYYTLCQRYGRENVINNPSVFGEIIYRPVDRRENYVKRCVGLPGDSLQIIDNQIYVNGQKQHNPKGLQFNYFIETDGRKLSDQQFESMQISNDDRLLVNEWGSGQDILRYLGYKTNDNGLFNPVYYLPLTEDALAKMKKLPNVRSVSIDKDIFAQPMFPFGYKNWTRDNYGPVYIPRKGATVALDTANLPLYERIIKNYEGNDLRVDGNKIYINGHLADSYTFKMNYYWMMGDNRHNSADSRYWGFVPEDHIVGKPLFVWLSVDKDASLFSAIRWNRFFAPVDGFK